MISKFINRAAMRLIVVKGKGSLRSLQKSSEAPMQEFQGRVSYTLI